MKPRLAIAVLCLCLAGLVAAGCGAAPAATAPSGPAPQKAQPSGQSQPSGQLTHISFAYGNTSGTYGPIYVAKEEGFFQKHGLDVTLVDSHGGPNGVSYLLGGSSQLATIDGNAAAAAIGKGVPIVYFGSNLNDYGFECWAKPSLGGVADLKGKKLGVSEPGSAVTSSALDMLQRFGLKGSDVELTYFASVPERVAALITGKVDAIVLSMPQALRAQDQGFKLVYDLAKLPYASNALLATKSYLAAHPDVVKSFLEALVDAAKFSEDPANKAAVEKDMGKYTEINDPKLLEGAYSYYRPQWAVDPTLPPDVLAVSLKWEQQQNHVTLDPKQVEDLSIVQQLEKEGYGGLKAGS